MVPYVRTTSSALTLSIRVLGQLARLSCVWAGHHGAALLPDSAKRRYGQHHSPARVSDDMGNGEGRGGAYSSPRRDALLDAMLGWEGDDRRDGDCLGCALCLAAGCVGLDWESTTAGGLEAGTANGWLSRMETVFQGVDPKFSWPTATRVPWCRCGAAPHRRQGVEASGCPPWQRSAGDIKSS